MRTFNDHFFLMGRLVVTALFVALPGVGALAASCQTDQLAPFGLKPPGPDHCPDTPNCIVNFKGHEWWTSFQYVGSHYYNSYYYNGGLKTPFAQEHVFRRADGLHLKVSNDIDLGAGKKWSGAEAVLMFKDQTHINLGYGDYLVTAKVLTTPSWSTLDPNVAVGLFTYERVGQPATQNGPWPTTGGAQNPNREIDLAEISKFGNEPGSSQFATQLWDKSSNSVFRYDAGNNDTVTLVMRWRGSAQPVAFRKYAGTVTLESLSSRTPASFPWRGPIDKTPADFMTATPAELNAFIPSTNCERFHINFWMGNFRGGSNGLNPPPQSPQEVVITNFEFRPLP
jgi:hypothetical protein